MSDIAIRVQNLSKLYRIGAKEHAPRTLGQTARSLVAAPFDYLQRMMRPPTEEETLWALRDVSFKVKRGEVVGIPSTGSEQALGATARASVRY